MRSNNYKLLFLALASAAGAAAASFAYREVYQEAFVVDFSVLIKPIGIVLACLVGALLAAFGEWILVFQLGERLGKWGLVVFNLLFAVLTFASLVGPFTANFPIDFEHPELFAGLTVPMHLFPIMAWMTLRPIFFAGK